jgi:hypothetical protein
MGAPSSAILAKIFLQLLEDNTLVRDKIIGTFKYADDKLMNYNETLTDTNLTLQKFNNIQPTLQFTMKKEQNYKINLLNIRIRRT